MSRFFFSALALGAFVACNGSGNGTGAVLGVSVAPITTQAATQAASQAATNQAAAITITRIRILVNEAKLHGQGKCDEVESGPVVVDLSPDEIANGATRNFSLGVSPGTYRDAEVEIEPLTADRDGDATTSSSADLADFKTSGASLLVDGTYQGNTFQFVGHFKAEQGQEAATTTTSSTVVIPMKVDPSTWFVDAGGNVLDPTDATQHQAIAVNICKQLDTETDQESASSSSSSSASSASSSSTSSGPAAPRHHGVPHCVEP